MPFAFRPKGSPCDRPSTEMVLKRLFTPATEIAPDAWSVTWMRGSRRAMSSTERLLCGVSSSWRPLTEVPTPLLSGLNVSSMRERSEEHTSELQSLMRISYAVFCLKNKKVQQQN